ncbi:siderophore ABC transporter substrate-binding protein [Hazenella coriacea]|uniref:Iron complex transport system substrate-binding protein n=1 Tax=Hazenella coriacea TaxID=1179467 RepID=A0A4R3L1H6_9BACL|nr:siderophore ABC transporter substrate-binding protein [Hazenella coriacea]TCS93239.1 iron complex transport system substrate-binding protein [Hazenella coriacea]
MFKKLSLMLMVAVLAVVAIACSSNENPSQAEATGGEEIVIKHKLGETKVKKKPQKVVVFDFGSLDTLERLGIEVTALPKNNIPTYLSKFKNDKYVNVGSLKEPDFEKIVEVQPDLIIISGRQASLYDEFKKIAPTIDLEVDPANYINSFKNNAKTLGKIFDQEAAVEAELTQIDESVKKLKDQATASNQKALIILANDGKVSAYGPNSRFGLIHDEFGLAPADNKIEVSNHGQSISFEYIVEKDPDYLFVIDRGAVVGGQSSAKQMVENELVKKTKAYQSGKIIYLDPNYWYLSGGGLGSVSEMVKEVKKGLK